MGGAIKARTRSKIGTLFEAWIPLAAEVVAESSSWPTQEIQPTASMLQQKGYFAGLQVLVVEDNFINQRVLVQLLSQLGALATPVNDGIEALEILGNDRDRFDVVFMDCQMPRLDGYETTRAVRLQERSGEKRIPIVAMTAYTMPGDRQKCIESGMDDYLSKPVDTGELHRVLSAIQKQLGA
jgi:CheY-like chemotaxis protein